MSFSVESCVEELGRQAESVSITVDAIKEALITEQHLGLVTNPKVVSFRDYSPQSAAEAEIQQFNLTLRIPSRFRTHDEISAWILETEALSRVSVALYLTSDGADSSTAKVVADAIASGICRTQAGSSFVTGLKLFLLSVGFLHIPAPANEDSPSAPTTTTTNTSSPSAAARRSKLLGIYCRAHLAVSSKPVISLGLDGWAVASDIASRIVDVSRVVLAGLKPLSVALSDFMSQVRSDTQRYTQLSTQTLTELFHETISGTPLIPLTVSAASSIHKSPYLFCSVLLTGWISLTISVVSTPNDHSTAGAGTVSVSGSLSQSPRLSWTAAAASSRAVPPELPALPSQLSAVMAVEGDRRKVRCFAVLCANGLYLFRRSGILTAFPQAALDSTAASSAAGDWESFDLTPSSSSSSSSPPSTTGSSSHWDDCGLLPVACVPLTDCAVKLLSRGLGSIPRLNISHVMNIGFPILAFSSASATGSQLTPPPPPPPPLPPVLAPPLPSPSLPASSAGATTRANKLPTGGNDAQSSGVVPTTTTTTTAAAAAAVVSSPSAGIMRGCVVESVTYASRLKISVESAEESAGSSVGSDVLLSWLDAIESTCWSNSWK